MNDERLAGSPDSETLPGHPIHPFRGVDYEEAAMHLETRHRRGAMRAAELEPDRTAMLLLDVAERLIGSGHFRYDMPGWRQSLFTDADFPLFFRLSLRQAKLTTEDARKLYAGLSPEERAAVRLAVLVAIGYPVDRKAKEQSARTDESGAEKNEERATKNP